VAVRVNSQETASGAAETFAVVLARAVVPLWLFTGAVLKLLDGSPSNLPAALIKWLGSLDVDLVFVLHFTIAAELIVAGVMVLLPPLARTAGIVMLGAFLPVLVGDVLLGASSCGCFGAISIHPGITLTVDVIFFLALLVFGRREPKLALTRTLPSSRVIFAGLWSLASVAVAFGLATGGVQQDAGATGGSAGLAQGAGGALPAEGYYLPDYDSWVGRPFVDLDVASWVRGLPSDLGIGQQYVVFYRKDCEHCHELLELYFSGALSWPTTAIAVPERSGFPTENLQEFPCSECRLAELPAGVDWFFKTPVVVRLGDGVVECAAEVDPEAPECLVW
jgi:hypothetical protein